MTKVTEAMVEMMTITKVSLTDSLENLLMLRLGLNLRSLGIKTLCTIIFAINFVIIIVRSLNF
jgi:hypothetical protein